MARLTLCARQSCLNEQFHEWERIVGSVQEKCSICGCYKFQLQERPRPLIPGPREISGYRVGRRSSRKARRNRRRFSRRN